MIETVEGLARDSPQDARKRKICGDEGFEEEVLQAVYDSGLMGPDVDTRYGGMGGGLMGQVLVPVC